MNRGRVRKLCLAAFALCLGLNTQAVHAAVIFQEDWNAGISPAKWITQSAGGGPFTFDLGAAGMGSAGDSALFLRDASFSYLAGVRSVQSFDRTAGAQGLQASFKLMRDGTPGPFGSALDYTSVCGPWSNTTTPSGALSDLEDIEAGISTDQPNGKTYYVEDAPGANDWATQPISNAFHAAFAAATNKANAVDVRVTVGNSTGAKMEWSVGGGPYTVEFNTLGQVGGAHWGLGANTVSHTNPLRLFFGGLGTGDSYAAAVIDDIVVSTVPEPSSLALLSLGTMAMWGVLRRKR